MTGKTTQKKYQRDLAYRRAHPEKVKIYNQRFKTKHPDKVSNNISKWKIDREALQREQLRKIYDPKCSVCGKQAYY